MTTVDQNFKKNNKKTTTTILGAVLSNQNYTSIPSLRASKNVVFRTIDNQGNLWEYGLLQLQGNSLKANCNFCYTVYVTFIFIEITMSYR